MGSTSPYGRLFEFTNPITASGILNQVTPLEKEAAGYKPPATSY